MSAWPEPLQRLFAHTAARLRWLALARASVVALLLMLPVLIARLAGVATLRAAVAAAVVAVAAAVAIAWSRAPRRADALAMQIESRTPVAKNLLVTAAELITTPTTIRADVRDVVFRDAADAAARIDVAALFPAQRAAMWLLAVVALWVTGLSFNAQWIARARDIVAATVPGAPSIAKVTVTVTPPAYAGRSAQTLVDPERIEVLAGSVVHVGVEATAEHVDMTETGERHAMARNGAAFSGDVTATVDGFIAIQPFGQGDAAGVRRVISVAVQPDRSPVARIVAPGKDMFLAAATAAVPVKIDATDDIGLSALSLTYTKVSGSGENFTFKNGEFPLEITRTRPDAWSATATIALNRLGLEPGDVLVYRAVVRDTLPGREATESDAFVIEILRPGEAMSEGFSIDDEKDKYAISQQMIIIKTEKLIARQKSISAEVFADEARNIAAEQKKIRSEFVFMMGGEFEDASTASDGSINEEEEAANEAELMAGRMQNNGRRDIIQATRYMSDAVVSLTNINPAQALPREKSALLALQRAFTKSRYILRVLTPRERIDDARRLSGKLNDALAWRRLVADTPQDPRTTALLAALSNVATVAGKTRYSPTEANQLASIAESILRTDSALASVAQAFAQAGASIAAAKSAAETSALIDAAAAKLSTALRRDLPVAAPGSDASRARLRGALTDALKRGGGQP